jgi:TP901 family phage tail tape measure protein
MALEQLGLGAVVKFSGEQAIIGMRGLGDQATKLSSQMASAGQSIGGGFQTAGKGIAEIGAAFAPFSVAVAYGSNAAFEFEKQMSAVAAVASTTPDELAALTLRAKELGTTTQFSAVEVGKAMEELARAGFSAKETLVGIDGVIAAAAADSISLETSASILSSTLRAMGLEAGKMTNVADVLAKASAITNTNITEMGEALKYAAPVAHTMGLKLTDVVSEIGAMADVGVKGTLAGTALKNSMLKLADPTEKAAGYMEDLGVKIMKNRDGSLDLFGTFQTLRQGMSKITDVTQRAAIMSEIFGLRGIPAFTAWQASVERAEEGGNHFTNMQKELNKQFKTGGAAAEMAAKRLDNFLGAAQILKSQIDVFAIEFFQNFQTGGKQTLQAISGFLKDVIGTLRLLNDGVQEGDDKFSQFGATAVAVATGIKEGITTVQQVIVFAKEKFQEFFGMLNDSNADATTQFAKWATIIGLLGGILAPVIVAIGGLVYLIGTALTFAFAAVSVEALAVIALIAFAIDSLKQDTESWGQFAMRIFEGVKGFILSIIDEAIMPMWNAFITAAGPALKYLYDSFTLLFGTIMHAVTALQPLFSVVFGAIGTILGYVVQGLAGLLGGIVTGISYVIDFIIGALRKVAHVAIQIAEGSNKIGMFFGGKDQLSGNDAMGALAEFAAGSAHDQGKDVQTKSNEALANFGKSPAEPAADYSLVNSAEADAAAFKDVVKNNLANFEVAPPVQVDLTVSDERKIDLHNCTNIDGRAVAAATSRNQVEVNERRGFKDSPWQRRIILEQGAMANVSQGG